MVEAADPEVKVREAGRADEESDQEDHALRRNGLDDRVETKHDADPERLPHLQVTHRGPEVRSLGEQVPWWWWWWWWWWC